MSKCTSDSSFLLKITLKRAVAPDSAIVFETKGASDAKLAVPSIRIVLCCR